MSRRRKTRCPTVRTRWRDVCYGSKAAVNVAAQQDVRYRSEADLGEPAGLHNRLAATTGQRKELSECEYTARDGSSPDSLGAADGV